jgi:hypothetical protein
MTSPIIDLSEYDEEAYEALPKQTYKVTYTVTFEVVVDAVNLADAVRIVEENDDGYPYPLAVDFHNGDVQKAKVVGKGKAKKEGIARLDLSD